MLPPDITKFPPSTPVIVEVASDKDMSAVVVAEPEKGKLLVLSPAFIIVLEKNRKPIRITKLKMRRMNLLFIVL